MVVLQNCMDIVEGETGNCSGTGVMCDDDGTEEVIMNFEDAIDITEEFGITVRGAIDIKEEYIIKVKDAVDTKDDIPEAITFPPVKTDKEVSFWGVCVCVGGSSFFHAIYGPRKETVKLHLTVYCFLL